MAASTADVLTVAWPADSLHGKALRLGTRLPLQHRRGVVVFENENARGAGNRHQLRRGRNAVADRGNQCDIARIGIDQPRSRIARSLMLAVGEGSLERPGHRLASHCRAGGFLGSQRQGAVGGRIQIADFARHLEEAALGGKHERLFVDPGV